jgi:glycosyltransferase involved in cell wall biosynthesis
MVDLRPACLITGTVSPYRREPFRLLSEREAVEVIAFEHAGTPVPGLTVHRVSQAGAVRLAASGRYRAVIASLGGRVALPGAYLAARAREVPFVLWTSLWRHPRTPFHALSLLPTRHLYVHANAVATYGSHVSRHVERHRGPGAHVVVAPQAVDVRHYDAQVSASEREMWRMRAGAASGEPLVLFVGRLEREKGIELLLQAWHASGLARRARLAIAGRGPLADAVSRADDSVRMLGYLDPRELPALYAAADLLVVPSIPTPTFLEPWGLVVNEALLQGTPVVASDAVGAVAGGLVQDGETGITFPAGDVYALAARLSELVAAPERRHSLGRAGREAARALTASAWADGMALALARAGVGRSAVSAHKQARVMEREGALG